MEFPETSGYNRRKGSRCVKMKELWKPARKLALWFVAGACCLAVLAGGIAEAAVQTIEATGVYVMGDNDSPKIARDAARQEAMRSAVEQAGVYVESYSKTQNMELTEDDVRTISGAVLKVTKEEAIPELKGTTLKYTVNLTAEVDTDSIDLQKMMQNKTELEKLQQERDALKKQNEELLEKYEKAQGKEKEKLGSQLETSYDQTKIFDEAVQEIQRGAFPKAIQTVGPIIDDRDASGNPLAYAHYLRGRAYYGLNRMSEALDDFNAAERTMHDDTYPIWRSKQYRGLIYYDWRRYDDAVQELEAAYAASGRQDEAIRDDLLKARRAAYEAKHPQEQPEPQPQESTQKGVDWTKVITDIIIHSIDKGSKEEE